MIRIGVDAMGGDFAPKAVVEGAVMALDSIGEEARIVLFGDESRIKEILKEKGVGPDRFDIVPTTEVIEMGDHPAKAFQSKADSSITVGFMHLAAGKIDGFASAGSTGAMMVGSAHVIKPIEGIIRPTIATAIATANGGRVLIMDVGLNVDCKPEVLEQYATIGSLYSKYVLGVENPRVALLNIGEEEAKGNAQAKETYQLLKEGGAQGKYNFVGNVEGGYLFTGKIADVAICDGFVGNTILKMCEGLYAINCKLGVKNPFWDEMNYENAGGTPVLGINAPVTIGHGKSTPLAIKNMILSTAHTISTGLVGQLQRKFAGMQQ